MTKSKIVVCVINNYVNIQLGRTLKSLKNQTDSSFDYKIIELTDFWSVDRNKIATDADYAMFVYSGSVLRNNAIEILYDNIRKNPSQWYYSDESVFDAEINNDSAGVYEKPDYSVINFASEMSNGEAVLFSKEILDKMTLKYEGSNFGVAVNEMKINAAILADGIHIPENLLVRNKRYEIKESESKLLRDEIRKFTEEKVSKYIKSRPDLQTERKVSIVFLDDSDNLEEYLKNYPDYFEIVKTTRGLSYYDKCREGVSKAANEILCFIDKGFNISDISVFRKLADYVSGENIGIVSPCIYNRDTLVYTGVFSMAGIGYKFRRDKAETDFITREVCIVRETVFPSRQFWMVKKSDLCGALSATQLLSDELSASKACYVTELAFQMQVLSKRNLFVGNVFAETEVVEESGDLYGFNNMLGRWKDKFFADPFCPTGIKQRMRRGVLRDVRAYFPEQMPAYDKNSKKVMVLTHELSLTGAPVVLVHAVRILKEEGWNVVVVSPADGVLKNEFVRENVPVIIRGDMDNNTDWMKYAADFDLVLINTVVPFRQVEQLRDFKVPVMWWLHDARGGYEVYLRHVLPDDLGKNIHCYSVSKYADKAVKDFRPKYQTSLLHYGLKDEAHQVEGTENPFVAENGRKVIVNVGTVINRKGQDIMAQAIRLLPDDIRQQCLFLFVGRSIDADIFKSVEDVVNDYPDEVRHISAIPHDEIFNVYKHATAVVCSSRDDPLPTFMAETMMVSGICICSENTGMSDVITNGKNGYIYKNNDPAELADCIKHVVENSNMDMMKSESRKLFENTFSMDIFRENLLACVNNCVDNNKENKNG